MADLSRLSVENLDVNLMNNKNRRGILEKITFEISQGESLALIGESGSGKTTLGLALMGLLPYNIWQMKATRLELATDDKRKSLISLDEGDYQRLRRSHLRMIFQDPDNALNPLIRVGKQVDEAFLYYDKRVHRKEAKKETLRLFETLDLRDSEAIYRSYPHELSRGMKQRVLLAMAIMNQPEFLIADEPTSALDLQKKRRIIDLFNRMNEEYRMGILLMTHDLDLVEKATRRVLVLYSGRIIEDGPTIEVMRHPKHPYTEGLIRSRIGLRKKPDYLEGINQQQPSLAERGPGCDFARCCYKANQRCFVKQPPLRSDGQTSVRCWNDKV